MIEIVTNNELNLINSFSEYKVILGTNPYNNCYYMKIDNQIIGFIEYAKIYDKAELNFIFVKEEYRKNGYAQKLFDYMLNDLNDISNITLEVNINNNSAINFYKKNGFEIVSKREKYYNGIDAYLMLKVVK